MLDGGLTQDLKYAARTLVRSPGFAAVAVVTLALGIGANSAIFSVVDAVVLRPLPYRDPEQLVTLGQSRVHSPDGNSSFPDFVDWREQNQSFAEMAGWRDDSVVMTGGADAERLDTVTASANIFHLLGVSPELGRGFAPGEDEPGKNKVVVLAHGFWHRRFGGDPGVVGRTLTLDGEPYTVIGVMPESFRFVQREDESSIWVPMPHGGFEGNLRGTRGAHYLNVLGRLKPGSSVAQAQADMDTVQARLASAYPDSNAGRVITVTPLKERLVAGLRPALLVLLGAVGFVLLIACANVANILLARATVRHRELAIRVALGASRGRIIRQMLTESALLGLLGGGLGLLLALWGLGALQAVVPSEISRIRTIGIDGRVLLFTLIVSLATGVIFGLVPALQASGPNPNDALKEAGARAVGHGARNRARNILVAGEISLALLLLVGAGLTLRSFYRLTKVDPGFDPRDVTTAGLMLPDSHYAEPPEMVSFYRALLDRLEALPGVSGAAIGVPLPFSGSNIGFKFTVDNRPPLPPGQTLSSSFRAVSPGYFHALGIPLRRGRLFKAADDDAKAPPVLVVNESFARKHFPGEDPIGQHLTIGYGDPVSREVVGIVGDVKGQGLEAEAGSEMYSPFAQTPFQFMFVAVRSRSPDVAAELRSALRSVDKEQPLGEVKTMDQLMSDTLAQRRLSTILLGIFGALALALALVGVYSVMSYTVTQRAPEIGIRMALGARPAEVVWMVVRRGLVLALSGVAVGLCAAFALSRVMSSLLFGVTATDPLTYAAISFLLVAVATLATYIPARRAARVDPMVALRSS